MSAANPTNCRKRNLEGAPVGAPVEATVEAPVGISCLMPLIPTGAWCPSDHAPQLGRASFGSAASPASQSAHDGWLGDDVGQPPSPGVAWFERLVNAGTCAVGGDAPAHFLIALPVASIPSSALFKEMLHLAKTLNSKPRGAKSKPLDFFLKKK
jgi:hypothetical protein